MMSNRVEQAGGKIRELEDKTIDIVGSEEQKEEKIMKESEQTLKDGGQH